MSLISAGHISKEYRVGEMAVQALRDVSFEIEPALFVSFVGPSGSGKTTPLKTISLTPVLQPVYDHINAEFGKKDDVNLAGKLYLLLGRDRKRIGIRCTKDDVTPAETSIQPAFITSIENRKRLNCKRTSNCPC